MNHRNHASQSWWGFFLLGLVQALLMSIVLTTPANAGFLQLNQSASATTVDSGVFFTYIIAYSCSVNSCENVQISTILDPDLDPSSTEVFLEGGNSNSYNQGTSTATWDLGNLSAGETSSVLLTVRFPAATANGVQSQQTETSITSTNSLTLTAPTQIAPTVTARAVGMIIPQLDMVLFSLGDKDNDFVQPPVNAQARANGTIDYKISLSNSGNVALTNLVVVDLLPSLGDSFVAFPFPRDSTFTPTLASIVSAPSQVTVYYSRASNPCLPEIDNTPPGCLEPQWSTTPPPVIDEVTALKFDFGNTVIEPSDSFEIILSMNVPVTVSLGEVAINSAAFKVDRYDNDDSLLPAEVIASNVTIVPAGPNVLLVKRITAVNGNTLTTGGKDLSVYINQPDDLNTGGNPYDDNDITVPAPINSGSPPADTDKWLDPTTFLLGGIDGGLVAPGDEIEYTIYFLSTGDNTASNVLLCDRLPEDISFIPTAFNSTPVPDPKGLPGTNRGIALSLGNSYFSLTNAADGDAGQFFPAGVEPTTRYPEINCGGFNTNGAVVVVLGNLPQATAPGVPRDSYGFIRFRGRVK
ncbi:MAG: hypothetical protein F6K58_28035 [Symploca sp. SIO2E9]|nr:hypothetical protein [Symploca sp. SIO2E9]